MTTNESFKKRVRARMERTGERYTAARRALVEQAERRRDHGARAWAAEPEMSDEAVAEATGRGWDAWVELIEADPVADQDHAAVASWVQESHDVDGWWAQTVTVGWERITGRRLPHQMADGSFTANKSRTMHVGADWLRALLLEPEGREALFPGQSTELRSGPDARVLRIGMADGIAQIGATPREDGRTTVGIQHEKLPTYDDVGLWKQFWTDWLDALEELAEG